MDIKVNDLAIKELKNMEVDEKQGIRLSITSIGWSGHELLHF